MLQSPGRWSLTTRGALGASLNDAACVQPPEGSIRVSVPFSPTVVPS